MAKKKADQTPAEVSPTPMVPIVINQHIPEQIQPIADQTPVEPLISQEPEPDQANQEQIQPIADQQPVEPLISQEPEPDQASQEQIQPIADQLPDQIVSPEVEEPAKKELTFAEKVIQKARRRNGKRMVKVLADTITNLVNPVEKDDNPDRA